MHPQKKKIYLLVGVLAVYILLVSTHQGEFWPFSIFPMYSQAGHSWTKTLVRDVSGLNVDSLRDEYDQIAKLPGKPVALKTVGINKNDLSNFISKTTSWHKQEITELRSFFDRILTNKTILIYKVHGYLKDQNVKVSCLPFVLLKSDSTIFIKEKESM